jgi:hypothetical protein
MFLFLGTDGRWQRLAGCSVQERSDGLAMRTYFWDPSSIVVDPTSGGFLVIDSTCIRRIAAVQ